MRSLSHPGNILSLVAVIKTCLGHCVSFALVSTQESELKPPVGSQADLFGERAHSTESEGAENVRSAGSPGSVLPPGFASREGAFPRGRVSRGGIPRGRVSERARSRGGAFPRGRVPEGARSLGAPFPRGRVPERARSERARSGEGAFREGPAFPGS